MATSLRLIPIVVLILVTLVADEVQAEAVCSNTPTARQWIECYERCHRPRITLLSTFKVGSPSLRSARETTA